MWWLTALFFLLVVFNATTLPTFQPNEPFNVDMVHATRSLDYPRYDERQVSEQLTTLFARTKFRWDNQHLLAKSAPPRAERVPFDEVTEDRPSEIGNHVAQHPPAYFAALAIGDAVFRYAAYDQEVVLLRILGAVMLLPLPLLAFLTARRLGARDLVSVTAATAVLVSPEFVMTSAIVNNDTLLRLLFGVAMLLLVYVWTGDVSRRTAVLIGVTTGVALLTKGFALALLPWTVMAYGFAVHRGASKREAAHSGVMAIAVGSVIGLWWWIYNVIAYGKVQPRIITNPDAAADFQPQLFQWLRSFVTTVLRLIFGFPYSPRLVVGVMFVLVGVLVILALPGLRTFGRTWADLVLLFAPVAGTVAIMCIGSIPSYYRTGLIGAAEGRYIVTSITGLAVIVASGAVVLFGRRQRWLPIAGVGLCLSFQIAQFWRLLDRNYGPTGAPLWEQLESLWAWYAFPPFMLIVLTLGAAVAAFFAARSVAPARFDVTAPTVSIALRRAIPVTGVLVGVGLSMMAARVVTGGKVTGVGYVPILGGLALLAVVVAVEEVRVR